MKLVDRIKNALAGKKLRANRKRLVIAAIVAGVLLVGIVAAWVFMAKPLSRGLDEDGGEVGVLEPEPGSTIGPGTVLSGDYSGTGEVYVWVEGINYAVPVTSSGGAWSYTYDGGLEGTQTLVLSVARDNQFGPVSKVTYKFSPTVQSESVHYVTEDWPANAVFKPVERAARATVNAITEVVGGFTNWVTGRGSGDLDQNDVPDQWQGSQFPPTSAAGGLPYTNAIMAIAVVLVVLAAAYIVRPEPIAGALTNFQNASRDKALARYKVKAQQAKWEADAQNKKLKVIGELKGKQITAQAQYAKQQLDVKGKLLNRQLELQKELAKRGN